MPRCEAIPAVIAAGADMILFNKSLDEDYHFLLEGLKTGKVTEERLNEAVTRILATKASLHLPKKQAEGKLVPSAEALGVAGCEKHKAWADAVADKAITLVRDEQKLLPISPKKFRRVYLNVIQKSNDPEDAFVQQWKALFEKEGFEVTVRDRRTTIVPADFGDPNLSREKGMLLHEMYRSIEEMKQSYDLYVYICNMQNASNNTTLRLNWNVTFGLGDDAPWLASEIPVMMISTAYPYHLFDAPMMQTYINAYTATRTTIELVINHLLLIHIFATNFNIKIEDILKVLYKNNIVIKEKREFKDQKGNFLAMENVYKYKS